jgi:hypothetical protein
MVVVVSAYEFKMVEKVAMLMKLRNDGGIRSEATKEMKHEVENET